MSPLILFNNALVSRILKKLVECEVARITPVYNRAFVSISGHVDLTNFKHATTKRMFRYDRIIFDTFFEGNEILAELPVSSSNK